MSATTNYFLLLFFAFLFALSGSAQTINSATFNAKIDFSASNYPRSLVVADFDLDGKNDVAVVHTNSNDLRVYKNTSTPGTVSLLSIVTTGIGAGSNPMSVIAQDVSGDGKPELIVSNYGNNSIAIYPNFSTVGNIVFAGKLDFAAGFNPISVLATNIDNDNRPDIVTVNQNGHNISVRLNTSSGSTISFAPVVNFAVGNWPHYASSGDLDGDGKIDLAVPNYNNNTVSLLRNTSTLGNVSFAAVVNMPTGTSPFAATIRDIDGDGKNDLAVANSAGGTVSVYRNNSAAGSFSFAPKTDFAASGSPLWISFGDVEGDGKPEMITANFSSSNVSVMQNTSAPGTISFAPKVDFATGQLCRVVAIADIDGDGKPDLTTANSTANSISVLHNAQPSFSTVSACERSNALLSGPNNGGILQWQVNSGSGFVNITSGPNYGSTNINVLNVQNIPLSFNGNQYRCLLNGQPIGGVVYTLTVTPSVLPDISITASKISICAGDTVRFTSVVSNEGSSPIYEWRKNGVNPGAGGSPSYTATNLANGDVITCILISSATCAVPKADTSNSIVIQVLPAPTGNITPLTATVCAGVSQTFTASGGTSYQWLLNGTPIAGATAATYDATTAGRYTVRISNGVCTTMTTDTAVLVVIPLPTGNVSPALATVCTGASQLLTATSGSDAYQWFYNGTLIPGATAATYTATAAGTYSVVLSNGSCSQPASNAAVITQSVSPVGSISPLTANICQGTSVTLKATGGTSYQWFLNGNAIGNANADTIVATQAGLYTVQINNAGCSGMAADVATVTVRPLPVGSIAPAAAVLCTGQSVTLTASGGSAYQWLLNGSPLNGATANIYAATAPGTYSVLVTDAGCTAPAANKAIITKGQEVKGVRYPVVRVGTNNPYPLQARNIGQGYVWNPSFGLSNPFASNPFVTLSQSQQYTVTISSPSLCPVTDTVAVEVFIKPAVYVPSAFTPNADGRNDLLMLVTIHLKAAIRFTVMNRWGEKIFYTTKQNMGWDGIYKGKLQPTGTYVWVFEGIDIQGNILNEKGTVTLIR